MVKIVTLFISLICTLTVFTQMNISVVNEKNEPISFCKLTFTVNGETKNVQSNFDGKTSINDLKFNKNYFFTFKAISYKTYSDSIKCIENKIIILKKDSELLDQVCITGEYAPTSSEQSINKITVITKDVIINSGASNLTDILSYQTNVRIQQDNILGSSLEMGGMSGDNVKILIDGVPVIGRLGGNIDMNQINLDNVERIEIVEGPLSVNYGTNSLAGTINIITNKNLSPGWNGGILTHYKSAGNYNLTGNLAYRHKNKTLKISGGRKYFDGWHPTDNLIDFPKETLADTNRAIQWNPKTQYLGEIQYILNYKKWQLNPYFRYYSEKITNRGFPSKPYFESAFDDYYYTNRLDQGINISRSLKKGNLKIMGGYNYYKRIKNTYVKDLTNLEQILTSSASDQDTSIFDLIMVRATYNSRLSKWYNYQIGIDVNHESAFGKKIKSNYQYNGDYAIFGTAQLSLLNKTILIKPGVRYAYNLIYNAPITPSLNVKYSIKNINIRASLAKGFRAPTLKELFFNFVDVNHNIQGNTDLLAEKSWNYNTSVTWLKSLRKNSIFKTTATFFYNDFNNLITLATIADGSFSYINVGKYSTIGAQSELIYRRKNIRLSVTPAYIGRENFVKSENLGKYTYSPEISSQLTYTLLSKKWGLNLFYKYNGLQNSYNLNDDNELSISSISAYSILDLSVNRKLFDKKMNVIIGAKNLLNVKNVPISGNASTGIHSSGLTRSIGTGISVFFSVQYKFKYLKR
jgi:outer membrane receptor for ferrienterochelin and colicins